MCRRADFIVILVYEFLSKARAIKSYACLEIGISGGNYNYAKSLGSWFPRTIWAMSDINGHTPNNS